MKNRLVLLCLCITSFIFSQQKNEEQLMREAREDLREGNKLYNQLKFDEAEISYKKALSKNPNYPKASYNLGNAIYQQNRNKEAIAQFELVEKTIKDKQSKAETYHNMGNSFMNEKQYQLALESYKNALRNNSKDDETRYNLALAKEMIKQQNKNNENNEGDKDIKPSEYAKMMKKKADDAMSKFQFNNALNLMKESLRNDKTTKHYQDFLTRLESITKIQNQ
ncbi:tetratricopeptide repeat protein [uncultured Lutibacter sp.]|uniref:tetratricopeptide repeat protein n=1 Tax=uncultured Lutibacter sp. TaxID=437739 RepID=UPI0026290F3F|nr:tetratricopeptide repeat protein [uncultured Lutibacter sp.]